MTRFAVARKKVVKGKVVRRMMAVGIKGTEEWKRWLEDAAAHCRMSVSTFIDLAATEYARQHGFEEKPPER